VRQGSAQRPQMTLQPQLACAILAEEIPVLEGRPRAEVLAVEPEQIEGGVHRLPAPVEQRVELRPALPVQTDDLATGGPQYWAYRSWAGPRQITSGAVYVELSRPLPNGSRALECGDTREEAVRRRALPHRVGRGNGS
jgi:hypothetical protein